jgi:isopentenyl phosphate kinase
VPASKYRTRLGVKSAEEWLGFAEVWHQAAELNHLVVQALEEAEIPALAFPPSAMVISRGGRVEAWNPEPLKRTLRQGLLPVTHGDVVFDTQLGGTILSTEDLFSYLAGQLRPGRLLFAGSQPGVWEDFPANTRLLAEITPASFQEIEARLRGSAATDVTGGMADKVRQIMAMVEAIPSLEAIVFSGEAPGNVSRALLGENLGTSIHA